MFVNVAVRLGSRSTQAVGRVSGHFDCTTAASASGCCKVSAVSGGQCSGDCVSLMDCITAVGN